MAIVTQYQDADEYWHDSDAESVANQHLYGVISGCGVTYDAANLTYDIAAGTILHNGIPVTVAAQVDANTLVADSTNPRWTLISLNSSGTQVMTSGTAAATPSKPEVGDNVWIAAVKIEAAQTVANNISVKLDKRVMTHVGPPYKYKTANLDLTTTTLADVAATSGNVAFAVAASSVYRLEMKINVTVLGTQNSGGLKLALTGPASPTAVHYTGHWPIVTPQSVDSVANTEVPVNSRDGVYTEGTTFTTFLAANYRPTPAVGSTTGLEVGMYEFDILIVNGSTAGTVTLQAAQNTAAGTTTIASLFATLTTLVAV
jgi:hypothetical protein